MATTDAEAARARVAELDWWHTIEVAPGVVTPGGWDLRPTAERLPWPPSLAGMSCLDIGTMDGFWAFEMERRGASRVVAVDIEDPEALDWPASLRHKIVKTLDETKGDRFRLVHERLGSSVDRQLRSVYEVGPDLGEFDLVYCGDLLVHIKDPITAVERMRAVCRGSAIVVTPTIKLRGRNSKRALAELDGIDEFQWWA